MNYFEAYDKLYEDGNCDGRKRSDAAFAKFVLAKLKFNSMLDVGCAFGDTMVEMLASNKRVHGVDVATRTVQFCTQRGLQATVASVMSLPFGDAAFDLVYCADTLEHLSPEDVVASLREMRRVSREFVALQIATKKSKRMNERGDNLHLTVWSFEEWRKVLYDMTGFRESFGGMDSKHAYFVLEKA